MVPVIVLIGAGASHASGPYELAQRPPFSLRGVRGNSNYEHGPTTRYPALALPEGPKDELVLPSQHRNHFEWTLNAASEIDVLVLGYSALDTEVLDLLGRSKARIRRMTVVNRDPESTLAVYCRIEEHGIRAVWPDTFDGSYEHWVDGPGLSEWVREFGGVRGAQYPSLTSPEELRRRIEVREAEQRARAKPDNIMEMQW